ncbi:DUF2264 domain-containing protein [Lachnospiraceae bacterium OttesenSCG-928-D06]|nr:DUF2264 domain-containing protein [Lachnospiraceae bacterium OttesenSCG-928-D06]
MLLTTKKDFQSLLFQVLDPVRENYSPGKALLKLGYSGTKYDERCAQMEGFARTFWGLIPFFTGGGQDEMLLQNCIDGLRHGTDPKHSEYWGGFGEMDQRFCEMAALALGLLLIPEKLWEPLTRDERDRVVVWLSHINSYTLGPNNWQFFLVLVNTALKKLGEPYSQEQMDTSLERIESFYLGDGWYRDGRLPNKDYYIGFAFHFYGLIYAKLMKEEEPERCAAFEQRAMLFARDFIYWFDDEGRAVPYGRSLTYRFAQVSFFSACLFAGLEPLPMPVMKGILARHLNDWFTAPIFDNGGILSIGYRYPNLRMAENYNGPGSPMWALKAFLFLALPDDHGFWCCEAAPMPKLDRVKTLFQAEKVMTREPGSVTLYPVGVPVIARIQGHMVEKYSKFAYSSKYGFCVQVAADILAGLAPDSTMVFEVAGRLYPRQHNTSFEMGEGRLTSTWSPCPGIEVTTMIEPVVGGHIRRHMVTSEFDCIAYDCGFALPWDTEGYEAEADDEGAVIRYKDGFCTVKGGPGKVIQTQPNANLVNPRTAIPMVQYSILAGETTFETEVRFV